VERNCFERTESLMQNNKGKKEKRKEKRIEKTSALAYIDKK
jgi:hypothetical protein